LTRHKHTSPKFQNAWNKHGVDAFVFEVLLCCDPKDCLMYEQIALDHYKPEYNILKTAGSSIGMKCSDQRRHKMQIRMRKDRHPNWGKHHSTETRRRIGSGVRKLDQTKINRIQKLIADGFSQRRVASEIGVSQSTISHVITGKYNGN
jgi:group I intron endonuclease